MLAFFGTTIGRYIAIALGGVIAVGIAYGAGDWHGRTVANKDAEIASLNSQITAAKNDARIAEGLKKTVQSNLDALREQHSGLARQVSDYEQEVNKLADANRACRIASDRDVKRLRAIR